MADIAAKIDQAADLLENRHVEGQVLICGGGNGAHVFAGLAAQNNHHRVHWLSLYADEAERINKYLEEGKLELIDVQNKKSYHAHPDLVTNDPSIAIPNSDVIILCVPAFGHGQYLKEVAKYANKPCVITVFPAAAGFEFQYLDALNHAEKIHPKDAVLLACETLPWACRIAEYGRKVEILGIKDSVTMWQFGNHDLIDKLRGLDHLQTIMGEFPKLECDASQMIFSATLSAINATAHPPIMYSVWKDWDGKPMKEKPEFYHGVTPEIGKFLDDISAEISGIADDVNSHLPKDAPQTVKMFTIYDCLLRYYGRKCSDTSSSYAMFQTNPGFDGLVHPMKAYKADGDEEDSKEELFVPVYKYRYLTEDVPFGLAVFKGIAEITGTKTPKIDKVIYWCQQQLGKEYLTKDGKMAGKDVKETRAPQAYGFNNLDDLLKQLDI